MKRRDLQVLGVRRWREMVTGKSGRSLLNSPKPTMGCSANGRKEEELIKHVTIINTMIKNA
jgi:hypothetical protein